MAQALADPTTGTDPAAVGPRIRALREAMGLSLRDLAERSGVGAQTLSQLLRLDEGQHVAVSRASGRRRYERGGHRFEELTPPMPGQRADVSLHVLAPGASTGGRTDPPMHEPGSRETAVVTAGTLALIVEGTRYELQEGDSVTFDADLPHHFENDGEGSTEFFAVIAAGLRRG